MSPWLTLLVAKLAVDSFLQKVATYIWRQLKCLLNTFHPLFS